MYNRHPACLYYTTNAHRNQLRSQQNNGDWIINVKLSIIVSFRALVARNYWRKTDRYGGDDNDDDDDDDDDNDDGEFACILNIALYNSTVCSTYCLSLARHASAKYTVGT